MTTATTMTPTTNTGKQALLVGGAATLLLLAGVGYALLAGGGGATRAKPAHGFAPKAGEPTAKEKRVAEMAYPASSGALPGTITSVFDPVKNRTKLTASFKDVRVAGPAGTRISGAELKVVSQFEGAERKPGQGELSVQCVLSLDTSMPGVLAPSSPPGEMLADGKPIKLRVSMPGESGYKSKPKNGGSHESLAFRLGTPDLLAIVKSKSVTGTLAGASFALTPAQLADLREFAARMNPASASGGSLTSAPPPNP